MSLDGALAIATSGLANINHQLGVVSNNVANAGTPDYTAEIGTQRALVAGAIGLGVRSGATTRAINLALQKSVFEQSTTVTGLATTTSNLQAVDAALGTPGQGNDLSTLLGNLQDAFSSLLGNPADATQQQAVVLAADTLTNGINRLSDTYTKQRQVAQNDILSAVTQANAALSQIGGLNTQIIALRNAGQSTADLENQRDAAVHTLSGLMGVKTLPRPNGDLTVMTLSGALLPTDAEDGPLSTSAVTVSSGTTYANGDIPPIMLDGRDITARIGGGQIGADIALRDTTLPTFQGELDEFSFQLTTRFSAQGLALFSDPSGALPTGGGTPAQSGYVGYSSIIQVNPVVTATPAQVRDGNGIVVGSPTGAASFIPNGAGGPAGFTTLITRVLTFAFGTDAQTGVPQSTGVTAGLGPDGTLTAPYAPPGSLADYATAVVSAQAGVSAAATGRLTAEQAVQTTLNNNLAAVSGVNMDSQMALMIQLQNTYQATARIIAVVQSLFSALEQVVQ